MENGTKVRLNSGGPIMIVVQIVGDDLKAGERV
jgi:uncharacterized protein YodC (DUF2158 family)